MFQLHIMYMMSLNGKRDMWLHLKLVQLSLVLKKVKNTLIMFLLMKYL